MGRVDMLEWLEETVVADQEQGSAPRPPPSPFDDELTEISSGLQTLALAQAEPGPNVIVYDVVDLAEQELPPAAAPDGELPELDAAEFEVVESLAVSIRQPPIVRALRRVLARHPRLEAVSSALWSLTRTIWSLRLVTMIRERIARSPLPHHFAKARSALSHHFANARGALGRLWSRVQTAGAEALALVREKTPRLFEIANRAFDALRSALPASNAPASTDDPDVLPLLAEKNARQRVATIAVCAAVLLGAWALGSRLLALFD